ncbi:MAG TPA: restriction endonuclease [Chloroflexota bacterium]|nr:restriction endonuclease [Chloroflexota bacterium]
MPVPDYQTFLLPLLKIASDGLEHKVRDARDEIAAMYALSEEDRAELLPSGTQRTFDNRVYWARTYLGKAGLLGMPSRGTFCITRSGQALLATGPRALTKSDLMRYASFVEFSKRTSKQARGNSALADGQLQGPAASTKTPDEVLDEAYEELRAALVGDVLGQIRACSWRRFEQVVVDVLVAMGYGGSRLDAAQVIGRSGDGGIDGVIKQDPLGLDAVYIQAKQWDGTVGRPQVQAFVGSLAGRQVQKGVMVTTSKFTTDALEYARGFGGRIVLISGEQLAAYMVDHGVGVTVVKTLAVKQVNPEFFADV